MNPRTSNKRHPRPPRQRGGAPSSSHPVVPSTQQVVPGAHVSMVLKEDQPTGREVQGVVSELLTRGNHPRGIKVRLADGRVGRVQRMMAEGTTAAAAAAAGRPPPSFTHTRDVRLDDHYAEAPPTRTLADYMPGWDDRMESPVQRDPTITTVMAKCPVCGEFEGDEAAVSHHVESHFE